MQSWKCNTEAAREDTGLRLAEEVGWDMSGGGSAVFARVNCGRLWAQCINAHFGSRVLLQPLLRTEKTLDLIDRRKFHAVDTHVGIRDADWGVIQQYPALLVETQ